MVGFLPSVYTNEDHYSGIFHSYVYLENRDGGLYVNEKAGSLHNKYEYVSERTS